jgi:hypothetical protein
MRLEQSQASLANWMPGRNNIFIDDIAKSVLAVTAKK